MTCHEVLELVPLHLTAELDPVQAAAVAEHLKTCPACRQEFAEQCAFDEFLRRSVTSEAVDTSAVDRRIRASIHSDHRNPKPWIVAVAGIAAALVLAIVGWNEIQLARPSALDTAAALDHHLELVDHGPRPWLTDRGAIERLAARQGLQPSLVSTLTPSGYRLIESKLCLLDGHWFVHLVYKDAAGSVSIFLRRSDAAGSSDIHLVNVNTERLARFQRGRLTALVVTNQTGQTVRDVAKSTAALL